MSAQPSIYQDDYYSEGSNATGETANLLQFLHRFPRVSPRFLDEQTRRRQAIDRYFDEMVRHSIDDDELSPAFVREMKGNWRTLLNTCDHTILAPRAGFGLDGSFMFVWKTESDYAELEFVDGQVEFFTKLAGSAPENKDYDNFESFIQSSSFEILTSYFSLNS